MISRRFGMNRTQRGGELANYVFLTKFEMAENLRRRSLGLWDAIL